MHRYEKLLGLGLWCRSARLWHLVNAFVELETVCEAFLSFADNLGFARLNAGRHSEVGIWARRLYPFCTSLERF